MSIMPDNTEEKDPLSPFIAPQALILVVDDNETNIAFIAGLLKPYKIFFHTATSAAEALELICNFNYDLVLMDNYMPGMTGLEAVKAIRAKPQHVFHTIPVIAVTSDSELEKSRHELLKAGMTDAVTKPIKMIDFRLMLRKYLPQDIIFFTSETLLNSIFHPMIQPSETNIPVFAPEQGLAYSGGNNVHYKNMLYKFLSDIDGCFKELISLKNTENWELFTVKIHGLKSVSRGIGAVKLSETAKKIEYLVDNSVPAELWEQFEGIVQTTVSVITESVEKYNSADMQMEQIQGDTEMLKDTVKSILQLLHKCEYKELQVRLVDLQNFTWKPEIQAILNEYERTLRGYRYEAAKDIIKKLL